ncbi:MAG: NAD(+)/NADH kinase [Selenomonadaceae bacterium]
MFKIAVFPNVDKENSGMVLRRIVSFCKHKEVELIMPMDEALFFGYEKLGAVNIDEQFFDMGLSIGGDGTLLGVCRRLNKQNIPVCGINIGSFGFLADIELSEIESKLEKILHHIYHIEERLMLAGFVKSGDETRFLGNAVNDVVVTKGGVARMLHLGLSIDGCRVADYKADGLIVSTATGSTAYSLSAGGPLINPKIKVLLVTPICPHTFNVRPMIIDENEEVCIHIAAVHQDILVTFDGQESFRLLPGDEVIVRKAVTSAKIVKFEDKNYYQILRTKLWGNA